MFHKKELMPRFFTLLKAAILSATIACLFFVSWYGLIAMKFGMGIIEDFFAYQIRLLTTGDAGHGQPFYYHALVLLLGCFPISILSGFSPGLNLIFLGMMTNISTVRGFASVTQVDLNWTLFIIYFATCRTPKIT